MFARVQQRSKFNSPIKRANAQSIWQAQRATESSGRTLITSSVHMLAYSPVDSPNRCHASEAGSFVETRNPRSLAPLKVMTAFNNAHLFVCCYENVYFLANRPFTFIVVPEFHCCNSCLVKTSLVTTQLDKNYELFT